MTFVVCRSFTVFRMTFVVFRSFTPFRMTTFVGRSFAALTMTGRMICVGPAGVPGIYQYPRIFSIDLYVCSLLKSLV